MNTMAFPGAPAVTPLQGEHGNSPPAGKPPSQSMTGVTSTTPRGVRLATPIRASNRQPD